MTAPGPGMTKTPDFSGALRGAACRNRTDDLLITSETL